MTKEYIEREALLAEYDRVHVGPPGGARKLIVEATAADVVEVVRCIDCGYSLEDGFWCMGCGLMPGYATLPDKWCHEGEQKGGE